MQHGHDQSIGKFVLISDADQNADTDHVEMNEAGFIARKEGNGGGRRRDEAVRGREREG